MRAAVIAIALVAFSCSSPTIPEAPRSAAAVERIQAPLKASGESVEEIKGLLSKAQADLSQRLSDALKFKSEMERWRAEGMTKEEELDKVWAELNKQTDRNMFLEENLDATLEAVSELEKSLATAREATSSAIIVAGQKDKEADSLRNRNGELNAKLDTANKKLASAMVYKKAVLLLAIGLATLWVVRELLPLIVKVAKPL